MPKSALALAQQQLEDSQRTSKFLQVDARLVCSSHSNGQLCNGSSRLCNSSSSQLCNSSSQLYNDGSSQLCNGSSQLCNGSSSQLCNGYLTLPRSKVMSDNILLTSPKTKVKDDPLDDSHIEDGWKQKARQRSSRRFGGQNLFNSLPH